jgi:predicted membrane metal-binding protein
VAVIGSDLKPGRCMAVHDHVQDNVRRYRQGYVLHAILLDRRAGGPPMFEFRDLFQWDRFITPTIIKTFYWLVMVLIVLSGISGIFTGLAAMAISPFGGFIVVLSSLAGIVVGIIFSRIGAEFILIVFRINEHLGAIRDQGQHQGH